MVRVKINRKSYKTFCGCDKDFPMKGKVLCYGDDLCTVCRLFPWAASEKSAAILSAANIKRNTFNLKKK